MSAASNASCPVCRTAEIVCGKWTLLIVRDLAEGSDPLLRARALAGGDQPAHALAAPAGAGGGGDRRAAHLPRGAAAGRVRADRERRALVPLIEDMRRYGNRWLVRIDEPPAAAAPGAGAASRAAWRLAALSRGR